MGEIFRKDFIIDLDNPDTIQHAIDTITALSEAIPEALTRMVKSLCESGVVIARQKIDELCVSPSGQLAQSVRFEMEGGGKAVGYVIAGYPFDHYSENDKYSDVSYAVFVEFGYGTANYYDTSGKLVVEESRIEHRKETGIKPESGRYREHRSAPSGYYRSNETYGILKGNDGQYYYGWKYQDRRTGKWYTSHGQNPKPFMYKTLQELAKKAEMDAGTKMGMYIYNKLRA